MSQEELSGLAGIMRANLSNIELGKVEAGIATLEDIAKALSVKLEDLVKGD